MNKTFEFLNYSNKKASIDLKVLNQLYNAEIIICDLDELIVKNVLVDEGPYGKDTDRELVVELTKF